MRTSLTTVTSVELPQSVVNITHRHLAATGRRGLEGIALWTGVQDESHFRVTEAIIPQQNGIRSDHGVAVTVAPDELRQISLHLFKKELRLLAQIHSHPSEAYHSDMDDECAIATALGAFSLVVPDFAVRPFTIAQCATYRLTAPSWWQSGSRPRWTKVPEAKAKLIFSIVEG